MGYEHGRCSARRASSLCSGGTRVAVPSACHRQQPRGRKESKLAVSVFERHVLKVVFYKRRGFVRRGAFALGFFATRTLLHL